MQRYNIVWQEKRLQGGEYEWLPFFIWGDMLDSFEAREEIEIDEDNLLKGILYELDAPPKFPVKRETLLDLLDKLKDVFNYQSLEWMILDTAADTRDINGSVPSQIMLETGSKLIPGSTKIKDDLSVDIAINS